MPVLRRAHLKVVFNIWLLTLPFIVKDYRHNGKNKFLPNALGMDAWVEAWEVISA